MLEDGRSWCRRVAPIVLPLLALTCGEPTASQRTAAELEGAVVIQSPAEHPRAEADALGVGGGGKPQALTCEGLECCPQSYEELDLSNSADVYADAAEGVCVRTLDGDDAIHDEGDGTMIIAGAGDDVITAVDAQVVLGGEGDDEIEVAMAGGEVNGGDGDDWIMTGEGHHLVLPGPGRDTVEAGPGPVVVQILDACELVAGESLSADADDDVIVSPVSLEELAELGVTAVGFERTVVTGPTCLSDCAPEDCVPGEVAS